MSKFAPLTKAELAAAPAVSAPKDDAGEFVSPVPSDAPVPSFHHPEYGEPVATWAYHDREGRIASFICRFETGDGKQVLPRTLWRDKLGQNRWRWKGVPAPRPLYNLDKLANRPDAPVVIVEGEKTADAAARIFLASVVTTSQGGSKAVGKADWSVLAGRPVLIWPDADKPGAEYEAAVAETLAGLGCEVRVIDAMALAALLPDGLKREPTKGWDAADAVEEWSNLPALRRAAVGLAKPFESGPAFVSYGPFEMTGSGLTVEVTKGRGESAETSQEWICGPFEVLGATRDPASQNWGKFVSWKDGDGKEHVKHISDASLQGDPASLAASLAADGLRINRAQQRALSSYLCGVSTKGRVTLVQRTGWHSIGGHDVFVLPGQIIGPKGSEHVVLDAAALGPYETRGSLDEWKAGVGCLVSEHTLATLSVSVAFAGPLLHLARVEGGGLNFHTSSSRGKTTILNAAASVWGRGASPGFVRAWRATANGLEGAAASATDTLLALDELGLVEARDAAAAIYSLSNGSGKARAARDGALREPKSWRVLTLSTGEIPLAGKLAEDKGRRARAGQAVRLLDIPADRGLGFGVFDHAGPDGDAGSLSKAIKQAAVSSYGVAGPEFVRRLIAERIDGETVRAIVSEFVAAEIPAGADGQIDRAAARLGLIAAAGELAATLGVVPWNEGAARDAAAWALAQWIVNRGGTEPAEVRQAIETVRLAIELHGQSRFEEIGGDGKPVSNRLGWRKGEGSKREWWVPPQVWKDEICSGLNPSFVAKALAEKGLLRLPNGPGFQCKVNIGGDARAWAYVLTADIIDAGGDDEGSDGNAF